MEMFNKLEYAKQYYKDNKEKVDATKKIYREKNKERLAELSKERRLIDKDKKEVYRKEYCKLNKEKISATKKLYREKNREKILKNATEYRLNNKDKLEEYQKSYNINRNLKRLIKCQCECGLMITECRKSEHEKTMKHIKNMENK
jgi:hypothetical protein